MSTWNAITITNAPNLTEHKIDKAMNRAGIYLSDLQVLTEGEGVWKVCGHTKYEPDGIHTFAADLSTRSQSTIPDQCRRLMPY